MFHYYVIIMFFCKKGKSIRLYLPSDLFFRIWSVLVSCLFLIQVKNVSFSTKINIFLLGIIFQKADRFFKFSENRKYELHKKIGY